MPIKKRFPSDKQDQYIVRFPDGMRDRIKVAAKQSGRSMNAEIIYRLQTTLEMDAYVPGPNAHSEGPPTLREMIDRMNELQRQIMEYAKNVS